MMNTMRISYAPVLRNIDRQKDNYINIKGNNTYRSRCLIERKNQESLKNIQLLIKTNSYQ